MPETPEEKLLSEAMQIGAGDEYKLAFGRWKALTDQGQHFDLELASSLAIGLGNETPLEVGLTVHHTYGMPVIPGSALKGLCRRGAAFLRAEGKITAEQFNFLFGTTKENGGNDSAGFITFFDAWYDPESVGGQPFHRDVITVHHQDYYSSKGQSAPTDFDDPNPVPFVVVRKGAKFYFAIQAPNQEWGVFTVNLMKWCLVNLGVGGKTNAGYGYFKSEGQQGGAQTGQAASSQQTGSIASERKRWENVTLRLNPGTGEMSVIFGGQKAIAVGSVAQNLRSQLSEEVRERLKSQRVIQADVEVEVQGNMRKIVGIEPK
jgi:CRISPR-associated protein Cmr6